MLTFTTRFIRRISRRPLVSLAWTVLTAATVYVVHYYVEEPDSTSKLEEDAVKLLNLEKERSKVEKMYLTWSDLTSYDSASIVAQLYDRKTALNPKEISQIISYLEEKESKINSIRVLVNTSHFRNEAYENMRTTMAEDIKYLDEYYIRMLAFTKASFSGSDKAKEMLPEMEMTRDVKRKFQELHTRFATLDEMMDLAREEHNVYVRSYNSRSKLYRLKSWIFIIAFTYIGAFVGFVLGLAAYRKKRKLLRPIIAAERQRSKSDDKSKSSENE